MALKATKFSAAYRALNARQREAVDAIEGPVMVVAGPGTGKTQVLTLRIANIITSTDTDPGSILALTFTEKAASAMRERLTALIGSVAYNVRIGTFHGFCNDIIGRHPDAFPHIIGGLPLSDGDQLRIVEDIVASPDISLLRPAGRPESYVKGIIGTIGDIKGSLMDPVAFAVAVKGHVRSVGPEPTEAERRTVKRMQELATVYARYEEALAKTNRYDYADMLVNVAGILEKDKNLRLDIAERCQYILVDEHQDTNRLQNRIVQLLAEPFGSSKTKRGSPNIFVVGDLEQAIYRFQGASPENFMEFSARYPGCRVIRLADNYRSSQTILDAAEGISPGRSLKAQTRRKDTPVSLYAFTTPSSMERGIARLVQSALKKGTEPGSVAVLYRKNSEADGLVSALSALGIPSTVQSDQDVLGDNDIRKILTVARAALHIGEDAPLLEALHVDLMKVSPLDAARLGSVARAKHISAWEIIRSKKVLERLPAENKESVLAAFDTLKELARKLRNTDAVAGLQAVVDAISWVPRAVGSSRDTDAIARLQSLFDAVRAVVAADKHARLSDFLDFVDRMDRHDSDLAALGQGRADAVQLMTAHKAKGLEFDTVVISNAARGHWDDARKPAQLPLPLQIARATDEEDDIRKLFYVAVTRARQDLHIAWARRTGDGKSLEPSRFVAALPQKFTHVRDVGALEAAFPALSGRMKSAGPTFRQKEFIAQLTQERPLSVSAYNNFIECPWKYYFINLVRIPEAPGAKGEYGTAAHEAVRQFFDRLNEGKKPSRMDLVASFRVSLRRTPLAPHTIAQLDEQGTRALSGWYEQWKGTWVMPVKTEVSVDRVELAPGVWLTGKLDKVEFNTDGTVTVVDYKTKQPMSANAIRGVTKTSSGNEYRQLLFYKLLLDRHNAGAWHMTSGQIDFLEPAESGKYKKETFPITSGMTKDLAQDIVAAIKSIRSLKFWDKRCPDWTCRYCRLRDLM